MSGHIFHVGERAILLPVEPDRAVFGGSPPYWSEVTVTSELMIDFSMRDGCCYRIRAQDGRVYRVAQRYLQKLPPSDPAYLKFREKFIREFALDAEPPVLQPRHPSIVSMLEFIGQGGAR